jgi:hypothetical protein
MRFPIMRRFHGDGAVLLTVEIGSLTGLTPDKMMLETPGSRFSDRDGAAPYMFL